MSGRKIKLLIVTDELEVGGTQQQLVYLLSNIDRERFDPALLYFRNKSRLLDELEAANVPVYHIEKRTKIDPMLVIKIVQLYRLLNIDQVHCFSLTAELWCSLARMAYPRAKFHTSIRGTHQWYSNAQWLIKRLVTAVSHSVVANSRAGSNFTASKVPGTKEKLTIIYNAVVKKQQSLLPIADLPLPPIAPIGLFVGRLVDVKNIPCLVRALRIVVERGHQFHFLIAGDGPERETLQSLIEEYGLRDLVLMLGERADVQALMHESRFLVLPSHSEGLSNTVLEAMINGCPVIASNVPGNAEAIKHGETGVLFEPNNELDLAENMIQMLSEPQRAAAIGQAAQSDANKRFELTAMVESFMAHYQAFDKQPSLSPVQ